MIKDLGSYIKSRRKNIGMTQKELAQRAFVTITTVSRWETGANQPDLESFVIICDVLGMQIADFIEDDVERATKEASVKFLKEEVIDSIAALQENARLKTELENLKRQQLK